MIAIGVIRLAALLVLGAGVAHAQWGPATRSATRLATRPAAQAGVPPTGKPEIRLERVAGEVVAGTYAGLAGYFVGRGLGTVATEMMSAEREHTRDQIVNGVGIAGAAFATGGAVYAIGGMGAETGSFPRTMMGVTVGLAASLALSRLVFHGRTPANKGPASRRWLLATLECSLPAIGGTMAFNSSRKWQR